MMDDKIHAVFGSYTVSMNPPRTVGELRAALDRLLEDEPTEGLPGNTEAFINNSRVSDDYEVTTPCTVQFVKMSGSGAH